MSTFLHKGITFHYEITGEGEPVIMLHGQGGDLHQPQNLMELPKGYSLIVMDQRAHGKTNIRSFRTLTFEQMAEDVIALADALGLEQFIVGGISMGAAVSVKLALMHPHRVKKLILIRCAWLAGPMEQKIRDWHREVGTYLLIEGGLEKYKKTESYKQVCQEAPQMAETFVKMFGEAASLNYPEKYLVIPLQQPLKKMEELQRLQIPVLVLANQQDPVHPYTYGEAYASYLKNGYFYQVAPKPVDGKRHKEDVNRLVRAFLKEY